MKHQNNLSQSIINSNINKIRGISTSDIDELSHFQINKNRRYTQLHPGKLKGDYVEVNLGGVQIFREKLSAGVLIEAAPASSFLPFATLLSNSEGFNFCGKSQQKNTLLQATGGTWDLNFKNNIHVIAAVFSREKFSHDIERLTGQEIPSNWLLSKASLTDHLALNHYGQGLNNIINIIQQNPKILVKENAIRMLGDSILRLLFNALSKTTPPVEKKSSQSNRLVGVRRVIDYLHNYSDQIPTIPELCQIANLSERTLQYGFKEYLGVTPIRYLRLVRLNGVRRELLISVPKKDRVVDVALNWGFIELSRFAREYRQLFQELPSETLNNIQQV
ncbi:helix-turn-helix domain-containing protein [Colwellia demingiae]|uniref:Helix-turn-helix domain-containing protein n=1 Tax=Colwellia demingiae TaxID=89401 RepID=A0A5C6QDH7_9GAMM|nr:helix-turn-helix domain-containing protein [Colwellia demingiae]TWX66717.1 helix-turn-helix domain-containing protein [Colwellia demingiae]